MVRRVSSPGSYRSSRWDRSAQAKLRILQRHHEYIANSRKDFLNKLACSLIVRYDFIALEELQIQEMVRNQHLSKSILDAGWGYLEQRLVDKAAEAGRQVVLVPPTYTSKLAHPVVRSLKVSRWQTVGWNAPVVCRSIEISMRLTMFYGSDRPIGTKAQTIA